MNPAHVESPLHQIQGSSMRALVRLIRVHQSLNLAAKRPLMDVQRLAARTLAFCTVCGVRLTVRFCLRVWVILHCSTRLTCST